MKLISKLDRFLENQNYEIIIKENKVNIINFKERKDDMSVNTTTYTEKFQYQISRLQR